MKPLSVLILLAGIGLTLPARADTFAIWWSPVLASQSVEALEEARDAAIEPMVLSNGNRTETVADCAAAADAFSRGFRSVEKGAAEQLIDCRALALIARAGEAGISSFRDAPVPDFALEPDDVFALPALAGPVTGCAETVIALRSDQSWWSLARHVHVYFDPAGGGDDGREAETVGLGSETLANGQVMAVKRFGDGGLKLVLQNRTVELMPMGLGDFNGDGLEDLLLRTRTDDGPTQLIEVTQLKPGTVMSVLDALDHFLPVLKTCPEIALQLAVEECRP